ncbi:MAG: hypothetical protein ACPL2E_01865 [Conexivisphaera sp.]
MAGSISNGAGEAPQLSPALEVPESPADVTVVSVNLIASAKGGKAQSLGTCPT